MASIPDPINSVAAAIDQAHEARAERPRPHLGASLLGHHCDRWLWLTFRWAVIEQFKGRILRLFRRGQLEEQTVYQDLRAIGCDVGTSQGRVDFGNHVSGSTDGVIQSGLPGAAGTQHVVEIKTHSDKSFKDLQAKGVEASKPMHHGQMQVYMKGLNLKRALYYAVNKNTDEIYTERVKYDEDVAQALVDRGHRIVSSDRMPEPCAGASPSWYQCKFCPAHSFCHDTHMTQEVNCRTCAHSTPQPDSTWHCNIHNDEIPEDFQHKGCESHVLHPDLVPWQLVSDQSTDTHAAYKIGDRIVMNGEPDRNSFGSSELIANLDACMSDEFAEIRAEFDGRIVKEF